MAELDQNINDHDSSKIESARKKFSVPSNYRYRSKNSVVLRVPKLLCHDLGVEGLGYEGNPDTLDAWTQIQRGQYGKYQAYWIPKLQKNPKPVEELEKNPDIYKTKITGYNPTASRLFTVPGQMISELGLSDIKSDGPIREVKARLRVEYNKHGYYLVAWLPHRQWNRKISPFEPFRTADDLNEDGQVIENER